MRRMQATFESTRKEGSGEYEFEQEALAKRHSMTHEAVQTGKQAGAYRTILSHFSQRYPKIPVVDASFLDSTCIAFDLMSVNLKGERQQDGYALTNTMRPARLLASHMRQCHGHGDVGRLSNILLCVLEIRESERVSKARAPCLSAEQTLKKMIICQPRALAVAIQCVLSPASPDRLCRMCRSSRSA